jgi:choline monooxygenase
MRWMNPDINRAYTLPSEFYRDEFIWNKSIKSIFESSWQWIAHDLENIGPNSVYPFDFLKPLIPEPLIWLKDADDSSSIASNVCTHRGNILVNKPGKLTELRCGYHGRRFDMKGCFTFMPMSAGMVDFPSHNDHLPKLQHAYWKGLNFAAFQPEFRSERWFKPLEDYLFWLPIEDFIPSHEFNHTYTVNAHWALYTDNYLEGFHIPFVHPELNASIEMSTYETILFELGVLQKAYARQGEQCFDLPPSSPDFGQRVAAYYFWLFPNLMLNFYPWGLSVNVVRPVSLDKTEVDFKRYIWKKEIMSEGAGADLDLVEQQDEAIVERVQTGLQSRLYKRGRFSPTMEAGVHRFHCLLDTFLFKDTV